MLRLYVENQTASEARIPIQWCVSKETIKKLENEKVVEPLLLLSITSDGKEVDRQVVPLDSVRTYVTFRKKGNHTLHGVIVWNNFDRNIRSYFLGKDSWGREYLRQVINVRGEFNDEWVRGVVRTFSHTSLDVNVSEEFFAKEPPKWLKKWVGCFYNNPIPVDQCGFRERVILSFSLLPIFLAIGSLLVAMDTLPIGLWFLLIGARGINWKLILSPWKMIMNQIPLRFIWDDFNGSIFIRGPDRWNPDNRHHPSIVCFTPVIPFSIFGFLFGINYLVGLVFPVTNLLLVSFAMVAGVSMIFFLATLLRKLIVEGARGVFWIVRTLLPNFKLPKLSLLERKEKLRKKIAEEKRTAEEQRRIRRLERLYSEDGLEPIVCNGPPTDFSVRSLPPKKRTLYLRYQGVKSLVCKPYSR